MPSATATVLPADVAGRPLDLDAARALLESCSPQDRLAWAQQTFGSGLVLTTSFGIQAAVLLHMVSELAQRTGQPVQVIWVDTGYLPAETYQYADLLTDRLQLRLHVAHDQISSATMSTPHCRPWDCPFQPFVPPEAATA